MAWIFKNLLNNLLIVFVIETPIAFLMGARKLNKIATVMLANVVTNPVVVFCTLMTILFAGKWSSIVLIVLEISALLTEGYIFSEFKIFEKKNPWLISLGLNSASFLAGEIIDIFI